MIAVTQVDSSITASANGFSAKEVERLRVDGWMNILTGLGVQGKDKARSTSFVEGRALSKEELDRLYRFDGIAKRIVNRPVGDMLRKGFQIKFNPVLGNGQARSPEDLNADVAAIQTKLNALHWKEEFEKALRYSMLYGGGLILMGLVDGEEELALPLRAESLLDIRWLKALHRFQVEAGPIDTDVTSPHYGYPQSYKLRALRGGQERWIHASRLLRFDGEFVTEEIRANQEGFGDSFLQSAVEALADYQIGHIASASLIHDFSQAIYKMKGLHDLVASNGEDVVIRRMQIQDMARSIINAMLIDADGEDFRRETTNVAGLDALLDRSAVRLSANVGIPMSLLFGMAPKGFAEEDKSGRQNWNEHIRALQEKRLDPNLRALIDLLLRSKEGPTKGQVPASWDLEFMSLEEPTDKERAELEELVAKKDALYIDRGVLSANEVATSRFTREGFSMDTNLDLEARALIAEISEQSEGEDG